MNTYSESSYCDIIVMSYNRLDCLKRCLKSVVKHTEPGYQLIIVDAGSKDGSRKWLMANYADKATLIFEDKCWSYAQSNNNAFRYSRSKYISLLNDDCEVTPGWLSSCINAMENDDHIGQAAHVLLYGDKSRVMSAGANIAGDWTSPAPFQGWRYDDPEIRKIIENPEEYGYSRNFAYAGFSVYRRDLLEKLGYLPEFPVTIYWDDTDFGLKINSAGYDVRLIPESVIVHFMDHACRDTHERSMEAGKHAINQRWGCFISENGGYAPKLGEEKIKPFLLTPEGERITLENGEKYKPLPYPVNRTPKSPGELEVHTWR